MSVELVDSVLKAFGGGALICLALSKWLGNVWSKRIIENIKAQHAMELANFRSELDIKLEKTKWPMTREDALSGEFREALENVVLPLMSAIHSICWLTWLVAEFPNKVSIDNLNKYDKEAHALLPKVSGYLALVAAYDEQVFIQLKTHVRKLYELDSNVGTFTHKLLSAIDLNDESEIKKNIQRLTQYHDQAVRLEDEIPSSVADLINDAIKRRALIVTSAQTNDLQSPTITQVSGSSDV